jgi:hypothetical protein
MLPAFLVLTLRPHELTRKQLKELSFALDLAGFTAINLQAAWQETTNEDSDRNDTAVKNFLASAAPALYLQRQPFILRLSISIASVK